MSDPVNHPSHYAFGGIEVLDVIEDWGLNYHLGNAVKYLARAGRKNPDKAAEDIRKCGFYLRRWSDKIRKGVGQSPPWVSNCAHSLDAVAEAWNLEPARLEILSSVWYLPDLTETLKLVEALAKDIEARGAKEVLCLS